MPEPTPRVSSVNPYDSPATAATPAPAGTGFRDRRGALTAFGVLQILLGGLCLLLAVGTVVGQALSARVLEQEVNYLQAVPSVLFYVMVAAALVFVGFGSIGAKKWARSLALILAWSWLVTGLLSLVSMALVLPRLLSAMPEMEAAPEGMMTVVLAIGLAVTGVFLVLIPGVLVLFYRGENVKATVEAYDRSRDWTAACPLPVLTLSLWMFVGAVFLVASAIAVQGAIPFFGVILSGLPGLLVYWAVAVLWGYAAWGLYKMSTASWWMVFLSSALLGLSSLLTFLRVDTFTMYEKMGYSEQQLDAMRQLGTLSGPYFTWLTVGFFIPYLAYLVYLKKYFRVIPPGTT